MIQGWVLSSWGTVDDASHYVLHCQENKRMRRWWKHPGARGDGGEEDERKRGREERARGSGGPGENGSWEEGGNNRDKGGGFETTRRDLWLGPFTEPEGKQVVQEGPTSMWLLTQLSGDKPAL